MCLLFPYCSTLRQEDWLKEERKKWGNRALLPVSTRASKLHDCQWGNALNSLFSLTVEWCCSYVRVMKRHVLRTCERFDLRLIKCSRQCFLSKLPFYIFSLWIVSLWRAYLPDETIFLCSSVLSGNCGHFCKKIVSLYFCGSDQRIFFLKRFDLWRQLSSFNFTSCLVQFCG